MKAALLGYPQSGKRTLFTLLTGREVHHGGPETDTVEGLAPVRDPRVAVLAEICKPERAIYAENQVVLCPDVGVADSKRAWLEAARRCDLLCFVLRDFAAEHVYHHRGEPAASKDRADLSAELILADLELVETRLERLARERRRGPDAGRELEKKTLDKCRECLDAEKRLCDCPIEEHELAAVKSLGLLTLKPVLWAYNADEGKLGEERGRGPDCFVVSCLIEQEIAQIEDPAETEEYMKALGLAESGLDRLNAAAYDALGLMSFYTIANNEVRAWTILKGSTAPEAGAKVHTDIERGFIRVEVIKFDDLVAFGSEQEARDHGKMQLRGRDYVVEDGDVCRFRFSV
jgi:GTP-binding protein YchF